MVVHPDDKPTPLARFSWERLPACSTWIEEDFGPLEERFWLLGWPDMDETGQLPFTEHVESAVWREARARIDELRAQTSYDPLALERAGLFLQFADLEGREDSAKFARAYGWLGVAERLPKTLVGSQGEYHEYGERLSVWEAAVNLMRLGVRLWQADSEQLDSAERKAARDWVTSWLDGRYGRQSGGIRLPLGIPTPLAGQQDGIPIPRRQTGAYDAAYRKRLLADLTNSMLSSGIAHAVVLDEKGRASLQVKPDSLWRLMWYQLAEAQGAQPRFLKCKRCGTWRVHHPGVARSNRRYCDHVCKQQAFESRRLRALELHRDKPALTPEQIAEILEREAGYRATKPATVAGWLAKRSDTPG